MTNYFPSPMGKAAEAALFDVRMVIALELMKSSGLITARPDGFDHAGRAKMRNAAPDEVVDYALECAKLLVAAGEELGWIKPLPPAETIAQIEGEYDSIRTLTRCNAEQEEEMLLRLLGRVRAKQAQLGVADSQRGNG